MSLENPTTEPTSSDWPRTLLFTLLVVAAFLVTTRWVLPTLGVGS